MVKRSYRSLVAASDESPSAQPGETAARPMGPRSGLEVCLLLREEHLAQAGNRLVRLMADVEKAGLDGVAVGDHVAFQGAGVDGLVSAAALLAAHDSLRVKTSIYLLPLRHPVVVARQLATIEEIAPGRFAFGVGVGGEDPGEYAAAGVDFAGRGARADEALEVLGRLRAGRPVSHHGRFYALDGVAVTPPTDGMRLVVGGRSDAALARAGRFAEGWVGVWVSPRRYVEATALVEAAGLRAGRTTVAWRHEHQGWCFLDRDAAAARARAVEVIGRSYGMAFERFERYTACGSPEDVAAALVPFLEAGCRTFNLVADAPGLDYLVEAAGEVRRALAARLPGHS